MPQLQIRGIPVDFPFEPYQIQRDYMTRVIECLENGTNGVLESPTGTGKTLSLLCSSLAWVLHKKSQLLADMNIDVCDPEELELVQRSQLRGGRWSEIVELDEDGDAEGPLKGFPKIIYASRTHSQLTQVMREMKNTSYSFMKGAVLGSRDQLCIHPEVSKEEGNSVKINMCKAKIQSKTCAFHGRAEGCKRWPEVSEQAIMDIEDLVKVGTKVQACPFFMSKELIDDADIVFMPYNYLLDPKVRRTNGLKLANTVIILDEAHNVEKMCEDSASTKLKVSDIDMSVDDVSSIMQLMEHSVAIPMDVESKKNFTIDDLKGLKEMLLTLERTVDGIPVKISQGGKTFPGTYMFDILNKANINEHNYKTIARLLESIIQYVAAIAEKNNFVRRGGGLQILAEALSIIFAGRGPEYRASVAKCYKVHVEFEEQRGEGWTSAKEKVKVVNFWCFNPGFGMRQLLGRKPRSIILTSGTLAPLKPLISELDIPVAVRLESPHIIDPSQVCVKIVGQGPDKESLNSSFVNRNNPKYLQSLGRTILSFCPIIPGGLLVFFPSYALLNKCQEAWLEMGIWDQIIETKPIFVEPRGKEEFLDTMAQYYQRINHPDGKGAVFMAVCRGKVSEGLDFVDMNGRAVIITGLPFPPLKDARVILKREYLEENRTQENEIISGDEWYSLEASRAVNQAIGRVIRHKNDYGAILLCDNRFNYQRQKSQLSTWIQNHVNRGQHRTFGPLIGELSKFFRKAQKTLPLSKPSRNIVQIVQQPVALPEIAIPVAVVAPQCFSSRLNIKIKSIDYDAPDKFLLPSSSQVTIHKRERPFPPIITGNSNQVPSTPKKLKPDPIPQQTVDLISTSDDDSGDEAKPGEGKDDPARQAPEDHGELLKVIKCSISLDKYKSLLTALSSYLNDPEFDQLMAELLDAFDRPELYYLLRAMRRFVKGEHGEQFQAKINEVCV